MQNFQSAIDYILDFFLDGKSHKGLIEYTSDFSTESECYIVPSGFFNKKNYGTKESIPKIPLKDLNGTPILFGEPTIEIRGEKTIIHADLVASAFYFISRYEEIIFKDRRDKHGRYPVKTSLLERMGILDYPLIDMYGRLVRNILRKKGVWKDEEKQGIQHIYLTHDVDHPWGIYNFKGALISCIKQLVRCHKFSLVPILNWLGIYRWSIEDNFDWIISQDSRAKREYDKGQVDDIYFFIATLKQTQMTMSYIKDKKFSNLYQRVQRAGSCLGIHLSYEAGQMPDLIKEEVNTLQNVIHEPISLNRNHYLLSKNPEDMQILIDNGIKEDFTMGFAGKVGFRLGTCKAVNWINPYTGELTDLILHPLEIMDTTLYSSEYMNLDKKSSIRVIKDILQKVFEYNGEFVFLFHNTSPISVPWTKSMYEEMISMLVEMNERSVI